MSDNATGRYSRRDALRIGGLGLTGATLAMMAGAEIAPRMAFAKDGGSGGGDHGGAAPSAPPSVKPEIQYAIGAWTPPPISEQGILFGLGGPVYTSLITATFAPGRPYGIGDQNTMAYIMDCIDGGPGHMGGAYPFSPAGVFPIVSYGLPYFAKVTALAHSRGHADPVAANIPTDTMTGRSALVEAVPTPTDVYPSCSPVAGRRYNVPVVIEGNDVLFSFRSDNLMNLRDVESWIFEGTNRLNGQVLASPDQSLLRKTSSRLLFVQIGLPKKMAQQKGLSFANAIPTDSPMWFGIADQNVNGAGPAEITAFKGNSSAVRTTAKPTDYFANATIQVLNHNISDLESWYATAGSTSDFQRRLNLMFRPTHAFGGGGGSPFWENQFFGPGDAEQGAAGIGTPGKVRCIGHLSGLQRNSRAADGTPMHARMDGPGYTNMDVPDGRELPSLEFSAFCPTGDFFNTMRAGSAATDLTSKYGVSSANNGLESFICATRRQNFLSPPRSTRALPLLDMT